LTPPDLITFPGLTPHERRIVELRIRDGLRANIIAKRLGITSKQVTSALCTAKQRFTGKRPAAGRRVQYGDPIDAAWYARQVEAVRALDQAGEHPHMWAYLRGVAMCQGQDVADEVKRRADAG
jgi:hypothetical protein